MEWLVKKDLLPGKVKKYFTENALKVCLVIYSSSGFK